MYKIERQLSSSKSWACLLTEYADKNDAIKVLKQKRKEYPHEFYRIIKFEVIEVE